MAIYYIRTVSDWMFHFCEKISDESTDVYEVAENLSFYGLIMVPSLEVKGTINGNGHVLSDIFCSNLLMLRGGTVQDLYLQGVTTDKNLTSNKTPGLISTRGGTIRRISVFDFYDTGITVTDVGGFIGELAVGTLYISDISIENYSRVYLSGAASSSNSNNVGILFGGRINSTVAEIKRIHVGRAVIEGYQYVGIICGYMYLSTDMEDLSFEECSIGANADAGIVLGRISGSKLNVSKVVGTGISVTTKSSTSRFGAICSLTPTSTSASINVDNVFLDFTYNTGRTTAMGMPLVDSKSTSYSYLKSSNIFIKTDYTKWRLNIQNYTPLSDQMLSQSNLSSMGFLFPPWSIINGVPVISISIEGGTTEEPSDGGLGHVFIGGQFVKVKTAFYYIGGEWKELKTAYGYKDGEWKELK